MPHILLYFIALLSLSTSSSLAKLNQMPAEVLGFWRLTLAALLLAIWVFVVKRTPWPKFEKKLLWLALSGAFFFGHLWTYKFAAKNTSIANTMILFATNPVWSTLGSLAFFNEKISARLVYAYILAAFGVIVLVYNQVHFHGANINGDIAALVSAFFYALFMLAGKQSRQSYPNLIVSNIQYIVCALLFLLATLATGHDFVGYSQLSWTSVMLQVLIPTFLGHFLFTYLVQSMNLNLMTCGKMIEPVFGAIIAYFLFKESLTFEAYVAFALTSLSLVVLFWPAIFKPKSAIVNTP